MCPCVGSKRGRRIVSTFGYFLSSTFALFALGFNAADAVPLVNLWVALTTAVTVILCIVIAAIVWNYNKRVENTYQQVKAHGTDEHKKRKMLPLRYRHTTMNLMLRTDLLGNRHLLLQSALPTAPRILAHSPFVLYVMPHLLCELHSSRQRITREETDNQVEKSVLLRILLL
jgi:hypothetical protein